MGLTEDLADLLGKYGWPDVMTTSVACRYCCCSRWTLQRAVRDGKVPVAGRRGKTRLTFRKEDLNTWMFGPPDTTEPRPVRPTHTVAPADSAAALDRIAATARGK